MNTLNKLRKDIPKKYPEGQTVKMRRRDDKTDEILERFSIKIIKYYPFHVLVIKNGFRECYTYGDMQKLTKAKRKGR